MESKIVTENGKVLEEREIKTWSLFFARGDIFKKGRRFYRGYNERKQTMNQLVTSLFLRILCSVLMINSDKYWEEVERKLKRSLVGDF